MATRNDSYIDFYEVLPANQADEAESAEVDEESSDAELALENSDESFEGLEDEDESEDSDEDAFDTDGESDEADGDESDEDKPKDEAPEEPQLSEEEKQKQHNREMAEKRIQEKQKRESAIKKAQQDYVAGADKDDPHATAIRQLEVDAYNNRVERNETSLSTGYQRALQDFPILRDKSPEIQREVNAAIDAFQGQFVDIDRAGNPYDVRGDLYAYLQAKADSITALTGKGARQQVQDKAKEKSKAMTLPTRAPKQPKKDEMVDGFDEEANRY